ncbi:hypothetical protein RCL_jg23824.t1 [Rhizophagus clarus]|uniref:TNFR-Cys domain-containing protein n=1 Tax=Rhizophagus clarus TaxID=94130 RepID=A0A8H3LPV5_9GLOM|nr:hypothetical protein RCL_jg23824.t1 [Rhizophagus clarus]
MNFSISFLFILVLTCFFFIFDTSANCSPTTCICCRPQGQYCGGEIGGLDCDPTHVYECNTDCNTCDLGARASCEVCGHLICD